MIYKIKVESVNNKFYYKTEELILASKEEYKLNTYIFSVHGEISLTIYSETLNIDFDNIESKSFIIDDIDSYKYEELMSDLEDNLKQYIKSIED